MDVSSCSALAVGKNVSFVSDYVRNGWESQLLGNPIAVTSTDGYVVINLFSLVLNESRRPIESSQ